MATHAALLAASIRHAAKRRAATALNYGVDSARRERFYSAVSGLHELANFVERLPADDPDLQLDALQSAPISADETHYMLSRETDHVLLRFWMHAPQTHGEAPPTEALMRKMLRRLNDAEAQAR